MSSKTSPLVPLTNYARTAARRLRQLAWVYVLNLGCLWAGLTVAVLACTYARQELTFDAFHEKARSLYRLESFLPGWEDAPIRGPGLRWTIHGHPPWLASSTRSSGGPVCGGG